MNQFNSPTKEQVSGYLKHRFESHVQPPSLEEIRRQIGWKLTEAARNVKFRH